MSPPIVVLSLPGSELAERIAARLGAGPGDAPVAGAGSEVVRLGLDALMDGRAVTVEADSVRWQGVELLEAGAVLLECPVFPWPQPQSLPEEGSRIRDDRGPRSLGLSAILTVASSRPVVNPPAAAHLAVAPTTALERLAQAGVEVHPWRLAPLCKGPIAPGAAALDVAGRDRWHQPQVPQEGQTAVLIEPPEPRGPGKAEVLELLVLGGRVAGARAYRDPGAWSTGTAGRTISGADVASTLARPGALAVRAAAELGLDMAAITLSHLSRELDAPDGSGVTGTDGDAPPTVMWADAGPDLARWDRALEGQVAALIAAHLAALVHDHRAWPTTDQEEAR
jgi:hypothetical protein